VIHDDLVDGRIFSLFAAHRRLLRKFVARRGPRDGMNNC
jgi:hypothetical protein